MYSELENNIAWKSYYNKENAHVFKCAEKDCQARLKIIVENQKEEDEGQREPKAPPKLTTLILKEKIDIKIPKLQTYSNNQEHKNHKEDYHAIVETRLKEMGIHPRIKLMIERLELFTSQPKKVLSVLRDKKEIPEKYLPTKAQIATLCGNLRKTVIESCLKNNKDSLKEFVDSHQPNNITSDDELICLNPDLNESNFLLTFTSRTLLKNIITQQSTYGHTYFFIDAIYKVLCNGFLLLTLGIENRFPV